LKIAFLLSNALGWNMVLKFEKSIVIEMLIGGKKKALSIK